jgi:hypothetical protein
MPFVATDRIQVPGGQRQTYPNSPTTLHDPIPTALPAGTLHVTLVNRSSSCKGNSAILVIGKFATRVNWTATIFFCTPIFAITGNYILRIGPELYTSTWDIPTRILKLFRKLFKINTVF